MKPSIYAYGLAGDNREQENDEKSDRPVEILYRVGIVHKERDEKLSVEVCGKDPQEATSKLLSSLIGPYNQYIWLGTGPVYRDNEVVKREVGD